MKNQLDRHCPVCDNSNLKTVKYLNEENKDFTKLEDLNIYLCPQCGFGYSYPYIGVAELESYYSNIYRSKGEAHE